MSGGRSDVPPAMKGRSGADGAHGRAVVFMPGLRAGGGAERYAVTVATSMAGLGFETILVTLPGVTREWIESHFGVELGGVRVVAIRNPKAWTTKLPRALQDGVENHVWGRQVRELAPEVLVNCRYRSELTGVGTDRNIYICHFPHHLTPPVSDPLRKGWVKLAGAVKRAALRQGRSFLTTYDTVCANSEFTASHVRTRWGIDPVMLPPACDQLGAGVGDREKAIITVGRIEPYVPGVPHKRLDVLVDTFSGMTDLHQDGWALHVVGACSPENEEVLQRLRERAADAPVVFHPNARWSELVDLYRASTVYWHAQGFGSDAKAMPQTQEHFGITTVEAMSAGCIPVVIDTAGPREVVLPVDGAGRWSTPEELQEQTRRIASMTPQDRRELSARCVDRARVYDPDHFKERLADIVLTDIRTR
ncbi:glycosyltransferase family 4 protein [Cutibacterium avidum]|uniref:glycosyltransferase family 4 protein n=1 Tax=Cutibacterium TaxID=1912216 RepID=UPI00290C8F5F|nr:glycosyltransferase family 4 protein [Cutibacterium avidum]